ncbi:YitT family protein [Clostridium sp. LBM24168]
MIKNNKYDYLVQYMRMLIGCIIVALGFNLFLKPNQIAGGGIVGISLLTQKLFNIEPAIVQWCGNIPILFLGLFVMGKKYTARSVFGSLVLPLCIFFTRDLHYMTINPLLGTIFGGAVSGIGLGFVFKSNGSTGGTSIIASIVNKYTGISIGNSQGIIDATVVVAAGFVFGADRALYAIIALFITSKSIDLIQLGFTASKIAFVVSDKTENIRIAILKNLDRGVTKISGFGGYTDEKRMILMVVMSQSELNKFEELIRNIDPGAFVIISNTHEVLGQGFNMSRKTGSQNDFR